MNLQHRVTVRVPQDFDTSRITVRNFHVETIESEVWFVLEDTTRCIDLPPDLFLPGRELRSLNTNITTDELVEFCERWGVFTDLLDRDVLHAPGPGTHWPVDEPKEGYVPIHPFQGNRRSWASLKLVTARAASKVAIQPKNLVHPRELWTRIEGMQSIGWFWDTLQGEDADPGVMAEPALILNAALSVFGMSVIFDGDEGLLPQPTIYNMGALQIASDLLHSTVTKICANETCRQPFTKQRGRTTKGPNRSTGVMYCSADCARAQVQREYRRRFKAKNNTNKGAIK